MFEVTPLVCVTAPIFTEEPLCVKFAIRFFKFVFPATVTVMFVPEIAPVAFGVCMPKDKISLVLASEVGVFVSLVVVTPELPLEF